MGRVWIIVLTAISLATAGAAQDAVHGGLLQTGREYLRNYTSRVSGVVLDERYVLLEVSSGRMQVPSRIHSDVILLNVNGAAASMRDTYSINGAKLREPEPRIPALLAAPTTSAWAQAQEYERQSQRHFLAEIIVRVNDPLLALRFMEPADPSRFTYSLEGKKKMNGVAVAGLRFEEIRGQETKYILGTRGNAAVSGRFWIDPATGAVHQTEIAVESKSESARVTVTYAQATGLDLFVPAKTAETYQEREAPAGPSNLGVGGYGASQRFEANAVYSNPRYTPIDLTKIRR